MPILEEAGFGIDVISHDDAAFPSPAEHRGVIVYDSDRSPAEPGREAEQEYLQSRLKLDAPTLGIDYGMHAIIKAAGGMVVPDPLDGEFGFNDASGTPFRAKITDIGKRDPLLRHLLPGLVPMFQKHAETVSYGGEDAVCLARGKHSQQQIVAVGYKVYGVQPHIELDEAMLDELLATSPQLAHLDPDETRRVFHAYGNAHTKNGRTIFNNFVQIVKAG